jgi:hypothetical protein
MIEQFESRTYFSASAVLGDLTDVNIATTYVKAAFNDATSLKSKEIFIVDLAYIRVDLFEIYPKQITASEFKDGVNLTSSVESDVSTKYADLANSGDAILTAVATDIARVAADVKSVAAKPKIASLRKLLLADIAPLEIETTPSQQLKIHYALNDIVNAGNSGLVKIAALDSKDHQLQVDVGDLSDSLITSVRGLKTQIDVYFAAVNRFASDARTFAL